MDAPRARTDRWSFLPGAGAPLGIARAEGVWLETADGRRILDAAGGAIAANVGHGRAEVAEAVAAALRERAYVVPPFATPERLALLARLEEAWLPPGAWRVAFASGGSEAIELAMRVARLHHLAAGRPERTKILGRELSYHGTTLATLAVGGHTARRAPFEGMVPAPRPAPACACLRCPLGLRYPECAVACAEAVEKRLLEEGPDTVAAFVAEPIVGSSGGALVPPPEYWPRVAEICRRHGVLLVADEVMTGFGRTGRRFAFEHFGVTPDIVVSGKGLSGGYAPIAAVFAREELLEPVVRAGLDVMFYTYSAHPAACAAAERVLAILEREGLVARAAAMGERLLGRLREELEGHPHVAEVRGRGLLLAVELVRDRHTLDPFPAEARMTMRVVVEGLRRGVFFYPGGVGPEHAVVVLGPPFVVEDDHLERIAAVLREAIDAATGRAA